MTMTIDYVIYKKDADGFWLYRCRGNPVFKRWPNNWARPLSWEARGIRYATKEESEAVADLKPVFDRLPSDVMTFLQHLGLNHQTYSLQEMIVRFPGQVAVIRDVYSALDKLPDSLKR